MTPIHYKLSYVDGNGSHKELHVEALSLKEAIYRSEMFLTEDDLDGYRLQSVTEVYGEQ